MKSLDSEPCFVDELLNFSSDIDEEEDDKPKRGALVASSLKPNGLLGPVGDSVLSFHEMVEEELEWISNKDAFPAVESFVGILSDHQSATVPKHHSPVSVLDGGCGSGGSTVSSNSNCNSNSNSNSSNSSSITTLTSCFSSLKAPRRARSKRRCRRRCGDFTGRQLCWSQANNKSSSGNGNGKGEKAMARMMTTTTIISRKCQHCGADKTPQWRAGPHGPKTLCNACGVRYKSGRLVPEYRPASSPTFLSELHSNSHRKILEMRRSKQMMGMVGKHLLESG